MSENEQANALSETDNSEDAAASAAEKKKPAKPAVDAADSQERAEDASPRRRRRSRTTTPPAQPKKPAEPPKAAQSKKLAANVDAAAKTKATKTKAATTRKPRATPAARPRPAKGATSAVMRQKRRRVYRQDPIEGQAREAAPPAPPSSRPATPTKKDVNRDDKITLLLHPAPKAAGPKKKKKNTPSRATTAKQAMQRKTAQRNKGKRQQTAKAAAEPVVAELEATWLTADHTSAPDAIRAAGVAGCAALIDAWLSQNNAAAIARVASLEDAPGKGRKLAKRALSVLKSRGIAIPETQAAPQPRQVAEAPLVASYVPPDTNGMTFFSIAQRQPGGRYRVADIITSMPQGIVHASSGQIPGKQIRIWRNKVKERFGTEPVEVPVEWARHCVAEARKQNAISKEILPLGIDKCAALFEPIPGDSPPHPLADLDSKVDDSLATGARDDSAELHADPEFRTWLPAKEALEDLLAKLGERVGADKADDKDAVNEAVRTEVAAATDRFFTPDQRQLLADRMRGSAISVRSRSGDDRALRVLAVAKAVRDAGLVTSPPSDLPFLLSFFQKGVAMLVEQGQLRVPVAEQA